MANSSMPIFFSSMATPSPPKPAPTIRTSWSGRSATVGTGDGAPVDRFDDRGELPGVGHHRRVARPERHHVDGPFPSPGEVPDHRVLEPGRKDPVLLKADERAVDVGRNPLEV